MTLLRWLTFLLRFLTATLTIMVFQIYLFLLMLVFAGIDVYIPHCKYQARHHLSPWFSAACAAAIVHQNYFFRLYQQNKSSESKVKFRQTSNCCNLKLSNLHMLKKQKSLSLSRNLALRIFAKLLKMFSTKVNLLYLLYSTAWRCCLLHLIKQNCLLKTFLKL